MNSTNAYASYKLSKPKFAIPNVMHALGMLAGIIVIILAVVGFVTNMQLADMVAWIEQFFGITFTAGFMLLLACASYAIHQMIQGRNTALWYEVGLQCANGISTLALTFTLLGISLGIGTLSQQNLSPDNINNVITALTEQFSMAFMTTVVGLPSASALRAWVSILWVKHTQVISHPAQH